LRGTVPIIDHLKLTFVAEKPLPSRVFEQVALMAADDILLAWLRGGILTFGALIRHAAKKGKSFYDDVMQGVFSIFFSFLFLSSLKVLWTILLSVPLF
jgi:hypothetical protein